MLTAEQRKAREHHFTASVAKVVMTGTADELLALWREMIGMTEPEDFADRWPVKLGEYLETFVLDWHQRRTGLALTERGRVVQHPTIPYVCATLDCYRADDNATLDVKICGAWQKIDDIVARYTPQCIVQRACRQTDRCGLLLMHGTAEPREIEIISDAAYEAELWKRIDAFWQHVLDFTPPVPLPPVTPPEQWRTIDLNLPDRPNWGGEMIAHLQRWAETKAAAEDNAHARDCAKALVPEDVGKVLFSGISLRRDRKGILSIHGA